MTTMQLLLQQQKAEEKVHDRDIISHSIPPVGPASEAEEEEKEVEVEY